METQCKQKSCTLLSPYYTLEFLNFHIDTFGKSPLWLIFWEKSMSKLKNSNKYLCRVWRFTHGPGTERSSPTRASSSRRWRRRTRATTPARPSTWRARWSPRPRCWTSCVSRLKTENYINIHTVELCLSIVQSNRPVSRNRNWFTEFLRKRQPTFPALSTPIPELTPSSGLWTQLQVEPAAGMRMTNSTM